MTELKTKAERVQWTMDELERLYPETPVPLDHVDAYTLLVAVLLSAQCTDARVNTVTPALFELADNPRDMMRQSVEDIRQIIRPCGLSPRKSAAISELSRILVEQHRGVVPRILTPSKPARRGSQNRGGGDEPSVWRAGLPVVPHPQRSTVGTRTANRWNK